MPIPFLAAPLLIRYFLLNDGGQRWRRGMGFSVFCWGWLGWLSSGAIAQVPAQVPTPPVVPDQTLPSPSIVEGGDRQWQIQGGTATGQNLFHSFERFSVPTDHTVRFVPSGDIARIIARVTGADASLIDGILGSDGPASLFLINPNGLVLGPNAQLQLGGSFIGTTAESMVFADGTQFGIGTNGDATPLLTATVPLGLQFGRGSGDITGTGLGPTATPGLTIAPGNTLGLIGRSLDFSGVAIAVPGGNLELGAVTDGTVGLSGSGLGPWQLDYGAVTGFGSLGLGQGSSAV
ncbi:MAG: filamentous hemagglutinin N-terminal domain-containing protein, partial [Cyanobacteria bacterium P01_H01_bin.130]